MALFRRRPQGIAATEAGLQLLPAVGGIGDRPGGQAPTESGRELRVMASPSSPRAGWCRICRAIKAVARAGGSRWACSCSTMTALPGGFDVGIAWIEGSEAPRPAVVHAPALAGGADAGLLAGPSAGRPTADQARGPRRAHASAPDPGAPGLAQMVDRGRAARDRRRWRPDLGTLDMAVGAAVGGMGVAIADLNLIRGELASGKLVAPFDSVIEDGSGYFVLTDASRVDEPKIATFRDWIWPRPQWAPTMASGGRPGSQAGRVERQEACDLPTAVGLAVENIEAGFLEGLHGRAGADPRPPASTPAAPPPGRPETRISFSSKL